MTWAEACGGRGCAVQESGIFTLPSYRREDGQAGPVRLAWHAYGELNAARDNAVLICHHFSGSSRPGGPGGWWEALIGPGRPFDTSRYRVLCLSMLNNVGKDEVSVHAPGATVRDSVRLQKLWLEQLGIGRLRCVAGPSMGGFQALTWAVEFPEVAERVVAVATAAVCPPLTALVPVEAALQAIATDPADGLVRANFIMTTMARTHEWVARAFPAGAVVESMWDVARERAAAQDRERYAAMARTWQGFDLAAGYGGRQAALRRIRAQVLLLPVAQDLIFPPGLSEELAAELTALGREARCVTLGNHGGHLACVYACESFGEAVREFLA